MNRRMILFTLGKLLKVEGLLMIFPVITTLCYGESAGYAYGITGVILVAFGMLISHNALKNIHKRRFCNCCLKLDTDICIWCYFFLFNKGDTFLYRCVF